MVIGKLQKIKYLSAAEIRMVSSFDKDELFPTMKFVERSDPDLLFGGSIMNNFFAKLKIHINGIEDEDAFEIKYKIRDIFSEFDNSHCFKKKLRARDIRKTYHK